MTQLFDSLDHLYSQFLLRDILAKFVPGLLTLGLAVTLVSPKGLPLLHRLRLDAALVPLIVLYGVSFMSGMFIQFVGMSLGLQRTHVWPGSSSRERVTKSLQKAQAYIRANSDQPALLRVRERYAILKEMTGNYGVAFLIGALLTLAKALAWRGHLGLVTLSIALATAAVVLLRQNRFHANEQFVWEGGSETDSPASSQERATQKGQEAPRTRRSRQ